ncbi:rodlin [Streptomyces sp. NPDC059398]|uniref:rodlin n=1 Tax=Streptomyces sp. NPDC059398 TaxID=3346820 RepID=UPI00368FA9A8
MIKKAMATAAATLTMAGAGAMMASPAMAVGHGDSTTSLSGNGAQQAFGNSATYGNMSPQIGLIQGSLNKPCIALPAKANLGSLVGVVPISVQDIPILSSPQTQQCTENSTQAKGDEALSHLLDNIPILSGNGAGNGR